MKALWNFKCILISERSQSERLYIVPFQLYDIFEKAKLWTMVAGVSGK